MNLRVVILKRFQSFHLFGSCDPHLEPTHFEITYAYTSRIREIMHTNFVSQHRVKKIVLQVFVKRNIVIKM